MSDVPRFPRPPDLEGLVHFWRFGARSGPAHSGYRPAHKLHDNYLSSGVHDYGARELVLPGEEATVSVWLITPHVYPACVWEGRELVLYEGPKEVGTLQVHHVHNEILRTMPEAYKRVWVVPPELAHEEQSPSAG